MTDPKPQTTQKRRKPVVVGILALFIVAGVSLLAYLSGHLNVPSSSVPPAHHTHAAQEPILEGDPVVAKIEDVEIKRSEVQAFVKNLPAHVQNIPLQEIFPLALENLVNERVVHMQAKKAGLAEDPEVLERFEAAKKDVIATTFLRREIEKHVTDKAVKAAYAQHVKGLKKVQEVQASHILVEEEAKANSLIQQLEGGVDFGELAKENSIDVVSAKEGGSLGYVARDQVVPEFGDAAFALAKGQHSFEPVKSQFGYHIIKVMDKRMRPNPTLEELTPMLQGQLRQETMADLFQRWTKKSKVKTFDINGQPANDGQ